jgi:hypothetical protein
MTTKLVIVTGIFLCTAAFVFAIDVPCPPWCDCTTPNNSTASCVTGVTKCIGVVPGPPDEEHLIATCASATHVVAAWPTGCKPNKETKADSLGTYDEYYRTNCNGVSTPCSVLWQCVYVPPVTTTDTAWCTEKPNGQAGNWTYQDKWTEAPCAAPTPK